MLGGTPRSTTDRRRRVTRAVTAAAALSVLSAPAATAASPAHASAAPARRLAARPFDAKVAPSVHATTRTAGRAVVPLKTFNGSFTVGGVAFPYTMVGSAPTGAAATSTIANSLTPVTFKFASDGSTMGVPAATMTKIKGSGLYVNKAFPGGTGQYGDIFMRTQFWTQITSGAKNWHVKLAAPTVRPTLVLTVPAAQGNTTVSGGVKTGLVDINWFNNTIQNYIGAPAANVFTQLIANNIVMCSGGCGIGGFHSAAANANGNHTYSYQGYLNAAIFGDPTFANLAPMSHELAEWLDDPFVNNTAPFWNSPIAPQYPCNNALEVGDPLVGLGITIGGLFYQDEAYLAFFARQSPSKAWQGRYAWFKGFTTPSPSCVP